MTAEPQSRHSRASLPRRARRLSKWLIRAGPSDYLLEISTASASLPVVGRHLEPLGGVTAMGVWGSRHVSRFLSKTAKSRLIPGSSASRKRDRNDTRAVSEAALREVFSAADLNIAWPAPERTAPVWKALQHRRHLHRSSVRYGSDPAQLLDVWRRNHLPVKPAPVLVFLPGGAWVHGGRTLQGYALLSHLAELGWVCVSVEYRAAPHNRWPRHIVDVKTAIAWVHANIDKFGGDRNFVAVAGCSAGGHLAALAGLTGSSVQDPDFAAELPPGSDTSVDAVVGLYGRYDWQDRSTPERAEFMDYLERVVVRRRFSRHTELYRKASPIARLRPDAPPFLVIHGSGDTIIPVAQARSFVEGLKKVSHSTVGYLELPGAGHGFDMLDGARTGAAVTAIGLFLNEIHRTRQLVAAKRVI